MNTDGQLSWAMATCEFVHPWKTNQFFFAVVVVLNQFLSFRSYLIYVENENLFLYNTLNNNNWIFVFLHLFLFHSISIWIQYTWMDQIIRFTIYKVNKASKKKREKSSAKKERKATKTLAIVLGKLLEFLWANYIEKFVHHIVHWNLSVQNVIV